MATRSLKSRRPSRSASSASAVIEEAYPYRYTIR